MDANRSRSETVALSTCRWGNMRRLTVSAAVVASTVMVVFVGVTSAAGGIALAAKETGWVTYEGTAGVTFQHPESWTVKHETTGPLYVYIDPAGSLPFRRNINLVLQASSKPITAASYLRTNLEQISQDHGSISQQQSVNFDGTPGYRVVWAAKISGSSYELLSQWTIRHGQAWLFTYTANRPRFGSVLPKVNGLLASMKLPN
jgi:hypothetical protein